MDGHRRRASECLQFADRSAEIAERRTSPRAGLRLSGHAAKLAMTETIARPTPS